MNSLFDLFAHYKLFIETSTWMYPQALGFLKISLPEILQKQKKQIHLCSCTQEEINKFLAAADPGVRMNAKTAVSLINGFVQSNQIKTFGSHSDSPKTVIEQLMSFANLAIITQDVNLARQLEQLNIHFHGKKSIVVLYITGNGSLSYWKFSSVKPIPLGTNVDLTKEILLKVNHLPTEGDYVFTAQNDRLKLMQMLGGGGEGKVYLTEHKMVAKIFDKNRITKARSEKLQLMLSVPCNNQGICWPKAVLFNSNKEFIGYLMENADGKRMQPAMLSKPSITRNFPGWTRIHLVQLCLAILEKVLYLHQQNVIIGDLNPLNILIKDESHVFFVDTDSFQIGNFPCPVGTAPFIAPDIQDKDFSKFLRSIDHDHFAIAILLFMTLLPGMHPYSHKGGATAEENIRKGHFPYRFRKTPGTLIPDGPWRNIWSHLPSRLREMFHNTFREGWRYTAKAWIQAMNSYKEELKKGTSSNDVFPSTIKIPADKRIITDCKSCGNTHIAHAELVKGHGSLCPKCQEETNAKRLLKAKY